MERPYERVHTVVDGYDGPREGIADFDGAPHLYRALFREDIGDWDPDHRCELSPVSPEVLALALEAWEIWCRWDEAFHAGRTTRDTHPTLPEDAARHREIEAALEPLLRIDPARRRVAAADFRTAGDRPLPRGTTWRDRRLEVRWTPDP